jgi:hypothetical protein
MATPRRPAAGKRRQGKLPKLTNKGKMLGNQEISNNINNWIDAEFEEELRLTAFIDFNLRRQIRLATGIGDMGNFVEEFNNAFANTSQLASDSEVKSRSGQEAFGESWSDRPRLRKISTETRVIYRPKSTS